MGEVKDLSKSLTHVGEGVREGIPSRSQVFMQRFYSMSRKIYTNKMNQSSQSESVRQTIFRIFG